MTKPQLRAKIAYCEILLSKHERLRKFFKDKLAEYREDLRRMSYLDFSN